MSRAMLFNQDLLSVYCSAKVKIFVDVLHTLAAREDRGERFAHCMPFRKLL